MESMSIEGKIVKINCCCANAVASTMRANGLESYITAESKFSMDISLTSFKRATLPILFGKNVFLEDGSARNERLVAALNCLSKVWGTGDQIQFCDPNYWFNATAENKSDTEEFRRVMRL